MKTFAATEAKNEFDRPLVTAQREPVTIEKKGRPVAVVVPIEKYQRLEALDDAWWAARADAAEKEGDWLGPEEGEKYLREILSAED